MFSRCCHFFGNLGVVLMVSFVLLFRFVILCSFLVNLGLRWVCGLCLDYAVCNEWSSMHLVCRLFWFDCFALVAFGFDY